MIYVHPWEIDADQPRIAAPLLSRFRHYYGLKSLEAKLGRLAAQHPCLPINEYLAGQAIEALGGDALTAVSNAAAQG